ncbi:hypothetical protein SALBM311S_10122 [Streptomyces alboniger]
MDATGSHIRLTTCWRPWRVFRLCWTRWRRSAAGWVRRALSIEAADEDVAGLVGVPGYEVVLPRAEGHGPAEGVNNRRRALSYVALCPVLRDIDSLDVACDQVAYEGVRVAVRVARRRVVGGRREDHMPIVGTESRSGGQGRSCAGRVIIRLRPVVREREAPGGSGGQVRGEDVRFVVGVARHNLPPLAGVEGVAAVRAEPDVASDGHGQAIASVRRRARSALCECRARRR